MSEEQAEQQTEKAPRFNGLLHFDGLIGIGEQGYVMFETAEDVPLYDDGVATSRVPAGQYLAKPDTDDGPLMVYALRFADDQAEAVAEISRAARKAGHVADDGTLVYTPDTAHGVPMRTSLKVNVVPVATVNGRHVSLDDIANGMLEVVTRRNAEATTQDLPRQDIIKPRTHYQPNTKLVNNIDSEHLYKPDGADLIVASTEEIARGVDVREHVSISFDDDDVTISKHLDDDDNDIISGVVTLQKADNRVQIVVTAAQIFEAATGTKKPSKQQIDGVIASMDRMRRAFAKIDTSDENAMRHLDIKDAEYEGYVMPADKIKILAANGKEVIGYRILDVPVLYRHAMDMNQVISFPQRMLETDAAGSSTDQRRAMKRYLLTRIAIMKNKNNRMKGNRMLLSTIYEHAGIDATNRTLRKRANDYIENLLKIWTDGKFIKGFHMNRKGTSVVSVDIEL